MTGDLGFYFMKTVTKHFNGELDDYHDKIIAAVDEDFVRYFAVAHRWYSTGPMHTFKHYFDDNLPKTISRRPRQFEKTRMAGGKEVDWPDQSFYDRFSYESQDDGSAEPALG